MIDLFQSTAVYQSGQFSVPAVRAAEEEYPTGQDHARALHQHMVVLIALEHSSKPQCATLRHAPVIFSFLQGYLIHR